MRFFPYPVCIFPTHNFGYCFIPGYLCYNALVTGNVRHTNQSTYELIETGESCWLHDQPGYSQTRNPGNQSGITGLNCDACFPGSPRGDRELPQIVTPGIAPDPSTCPALDGAMSDPCMVRDQENLCLGNGTSYSAPILNGISACVISAAPSRLIAWPEKTRAILVLTAHEVFGGYWNQNIDGMDGTGVVSGADAVWFARNYQNSPPNDPNQACVYGLHANSLGLNDQGRIISHYIKIPASKPSGQHLRIVLTWDSSPCENEARNDLSNLNLRFYSVPGGWRYSSSINSNYEVIDVPATAVISNSTFPCYIDVSTIQIPSCAPQYFWYTIAWSWVKDHAL